ncbi:MAG: alpha/beta fold hydrolase [Alistipes sp.]|nr:alpha/beta fold hydrolase [Alistipes sp.]
MKKSLFLLSTIFLPLLLGAQDITGSWHGQINLGNSALRLVFNITPEGEGYTATMDSPDQGAKGIPVPAVAFDGRELNLELPTIGFTYTGIYDGEEIKGSMTQSGTTLPLDLTKGEAYKAPARPQDPVPPYPYRSEEVRFRNNEAGVVLAGTLTIPREEGVYPAVIMVTGSGPQDRNEEVMGHRPFLVIADHLTRNGIAVLRYDDRGTAESTGEFRGATSEDFMKDAMAAFAYLRNRNEINPTLIGVLGHSEGGSIAVMMAAREPEVDFIVSLAGSMLRGDSTLVLQNRDILTSYGSPADLVDEYCAVLGRLYSGIISGELHSNSTGEEVGSTIAGFDGLPEPMRENLMTILGMEDPWMDYFIRYDPTADIARIKCPVFACNGSVDHQVHAVANLSHLAATLDRAGHTAYTTKVYDGLNHLFQQSETGDIAEYSRIEQTIHPQVLDDIATWINAITK